MPVDELPVVITVPEFMRRMQDMYKGNAMFGEMPLGLNVSINGNHQITQKILKSEDKEQQKRLVRQVYDLALLSQNMLSGAELTNFIERSIALAV
jgi:molecular chaperone HtpG